MVTTIDAGLFPPGAWREWSLEPGVAIAIACAVGVYAAGVRGVWRAAGTGRGVHRGQVMCFAAGMTLVLVALASPLDAWSSQLFAAHMGQHMLLAIVAPPLLVAGAPGVALSWAIAPSMRATWVRAMVQSRLPRTTWAVLTAPIVACALHAAAVWMWHAPLLYERAVRDDAVHAAEHLAFLGTAVLVWWRVAGAARTSRRDYAAGILVLLVTMMQTGLLGALLALSRHPWYSVHAATTMRWGLSPLEDQQLAGLIMWVVGGLLYVVAMSVLFLAWLGHRGARVATAALSAGIASAGCRGTTAHTADVVRGRQAIAAYGCGACHRIPGITGAYGTVGPPLDAIGSRVLIAGMLPNTRENLRRWIMDPTAIDSMTGMPNLHVDATTADAMAAYIETLRPDVADLSR